MGASVGFVQEAVDVGCELAVVLEEKPWAESG
jgi:hypothetical protein